MNTRKIHLRLLGLLITLALSACGKIPDAYRGDFIDLPTGTKLNVSGSDGTLVVKGRTLKADAATLEFQALQENKPGIYVRNDVTDPNELEVFWLFPKAGTRRQEADFVWMSAEVLYTRMNSNEQSPIQQIKMIHCEDGLLMLDLPSQTWNGGCPQGATEYQFIRTQQ